GDGGALPQLPHQAALLILSRITLRGPCALGGGGSSAAISSTVPARQPLDVPPTDTLAADQFETPPLVSCAAASSVASSTDVMLVIPAGAFCTFVLVERCPAKPTTQDVPSETWRGPRPG